MSTLQSRMLACLLFATPLLARATEDAETPNTPDTTPDTTDDMQRDLRRASTLMAAGKENEALLAYADFLRRYPHDSLAPEAQFAVGEIYFRKGQYQVASDEFKKVFTYVVDNNTKAAEASLRLGECWQKLGRTDLARIEWEAVRRKYPKTENAHQALVLVEGLGDASNNERDKRVKGKNP